MPRPWSGRVLALAAICYVATVDRVFAAQCLVEAPVRAPIIELFREPPCRWCAGQRGVVYATDPGTVVRAGASGTVWFSGQVGGVVYVVVRTKDSVLVTHGQLSEAHLRTGDVVNVGDMVGRVSGRLYFGVRVDGRYIDPLRCMASGGAATRRAILVPAPLPSPASGTP